MSKRKKNFLIALALFVIAKILGVMFSGTAITAIRAFLELTAVVYLIWGLLFSGDKKLEKE